MCFSSSADAAKTIRLATKVTAKATVIGRLIASPRRLRPRYSPTVPPSTIIRHHETRAERLRFLHGPPRKIPVTRALPICPATEVARDV